MNLIKPSKASNSPAALLVCAPDVCAMPITPAFTWEQTDDTVKVVIKSVSISKASLSLYGTFLYFQHTLAVTHLGLHPT